MVNLAKNAGFCPGVKNAVDTALQTIEKSISVKMFGDIIHNEEVCGYLKEKGLKSVYSIDEIDSNDTVVIRTHGALKEDLDKIGKIAGAVVDCTCPFVKKIHKILDEKTANGYTAVIIGDSAHDEVKAELSYCCKNGFVSDDFDEIVKIINSSENDKFVVVAQTTFDRSRFEIIVEKLKKWAKGGHKTVEFFNTICYTTNARQVEALKLSESNDAVVVVGSRASANTVALYNIAKSANKNVFFISSLSEFSFNINQFRSIAVLAGASTPSWLLLEVVNAMSETQKTAEMAEKKSVKSKEATSQPKKVAKTEDTEDNLTMDKVMDNLKMPVYKEGKRVECNVISADENGIKVQIGGKKDGFIVKDEACYNKEYNPADFKAGDTIEAKILTNEKDGVYLSKRLIDAERIEDEEAEKALNAGVFTLEMNEVVKGGLRGRMGSYVVFVPASQITTKYVKNLDDYKGKKLRLVVMPPKTKEGEEVASDKPAKKSKYIFASQRLVLEREKKEKEDAFWESIHVNDIVTGKVKRFTSFGVFVNVRGFDCLCHITEVSWNKITDASTVLKAGENYDFVVLKMDRETNKISLGYKQLQKKPYEIAAEKYPVGSIIKGKVERIFPYGAFVSIDDGVDGLVHVSQIAHSWIKNANEALKEGQEVEAKIIGFEDNRITLSIKELLPPPEETEIAEGEEKKPRAKKADGEKKEKKAKKAEKTDELREWRSDDSGATLGELLKTFEFPVEEEAPAPKKKAAPKKKEAASADAE